MTPHAPGAARGGSDVHATGPARPMLEPDRDHARGASGPAPRPAPARADGVERTARALGARHAAADLTTPRLHLHLRLLEAGDAGQAALYRSLYTCPRVMAEIGPVATADAAHRGFHAACRHNARLLGHRTWSVAPCSGTEPFGIAALRRIGGRAEFGAMFAPTHWGAGCAGDVLRVVAQYGFEILDCTAIDARSACERQMPVIERLLASAGFARTSAPALKPRTWALERHAWTQTRSVPIGFAAPTR